MYFTKISGLTAFALLAGSSIGYQPRNNFPNLQFREAMDFLDADGYYDLGTRAVEMDDDDFDLLSARELDDFDTSDLYGRGAGFDSLKARELEKANLLDLFAREIYYDDSDILEQYLQRRVTRQPGGRPRRPSQGTRSEPSPQYLAWRNSTAPR